MKTIGFMLDASRIKSRYVSVKNEGHEIYVHDVSKTANPQTIINDWRDRLEAIRAAMPKGVWTITLEQELHPPFGVTRGVGAGGYEIMDIETLEVRP